jgi:hypothetical protein
MKMKKGRDPKRIRQRNIALIKRFYHLYEVKEIRIDRVITKLANEEFFLAEKTIEQIIKHNHDLLDRCAAGEDITEPWEQTDPNQLSIIDELEKQQEGLGLVTAGTAINAIDELGKQARL